MLNILHRAEERELDIIAFTDHNSVRGYAEMWREIEDLELLEFLKRAEPNEAERLAEYRRLLAKILVLPGFEFTATFGFHILVIFPEPTSVRLMEHLLLLLGVPEDRFGSGEVGATTDVLRAYELMADQGALVIGAHANSTHGVAMQGLRFGGQTKIAYTQDEHLHALEVTDLVLGPHRRSSARFFSGVKAEYPRRMHCIQGSDAHRLERDPQRESNLGVGDRVTEMLLPERSFAALKSLFLSEEFEHTRPAKSEIDELAVTRLEGNTATQAFHENLSRKSTGSSHVLRDLVALANGEGGTVYVGASPFEKRPIAGVGDAAAATTELEAEIASQIEPRPEVKIETLTSGGKDVLAVRVAAGRERPYALLPGTIFVRVAGESTPANRDQIVAMVRGAAFSPVEVTPALVPLPAVPARSGRRAPSQPNRPRPGVVAAEAALTESEEDRSGPTPPPSPLVPGSPDVPVTSAMAQYEEVVPPDPVAPGTGVEVIAAYEQDGIRYFTLRDLRYDKLIHNVTRETGRQLWRSAITQREEQAVTEEDGRWFGDFGLWRSYRSRRGERRYHLMYRGDGDFRVFYGVSDDGMDERWRKVLPAVTPPTGRS